MSRDAYWDTDMMDAVEEIEEAFDRARSLLRTVVKSKGSEASLAAARAWLSSPEGRRVTGEAMVDAYGSRRSKR